MPCLFDVQRLIQKISQEAKLPEPHYVEEHPDTADGLLKQTVANPGQPQMAGKAGGSKIPSWQKCRWAAHVQNSISRFDRDVPTDLGSVFRLRLREDLHMKAAGLQCICLNYLLYEVGVVD